MNSPAKIAEYPSKSALRRAVEHARDLGIDVAGFEIAPGGVIRVLDKAAFPAVPAAAAPVEDEIAAWREKRRKG